MLIRPGQPAPDFDVRASDGKALRLRDFRGKKNVVLYFYPRDFTRICTAESCGFRDAYEELAAQDTEVIGVSLDSDESHRAFAERNQLHFPLVSDREKHLTRLYGAISTIRSLLGTAARVTYVIDKGGVVAGVFQSELNARKHIDGVREVVRSLRARERPPRPRAPPA